MNFGSIIPRRDKQTTPVRQDELVDPLVSFRREVDRMFDDFFNGFTGGNLRTTSGGLTAVTPVIDLAETEKDLRVTAEMPGLNEDDFDVTLTGDLLTIKGEKKSEHEEKEGGDYYAERRYGAFSRSIRLPFEVKDEQVDARYERGVLTVRIPKPHDLQTAARKIEVKAS